MKLLALLCLILGFYSPQVGAQTSTTQDKLYTLRGGEATSFAGHAVRLHFAVSQAEIQRGMMFVRRMADDQGMLFLLPRRQHHCMWMKNTYVPLSVAWLTPSGEIVRIAQMEPHTTDTHCAKSREVRFALEMTHGWFAVRGIEAGDKIDDLVPTLQRILDEQSLLRR